MNQIFHSFSSTAQKF